MDASRLDVKAEQISEFEEGATNVLTASSLVVDISKKLHLKNDTTDIRNSVIKKIKNENQTDKSWGSKLIEVYAPYIIVNQTEHKLIFSNDDNLVVLPQSVAFLIHDESKIRVKLSHDGEFSKNFNIDAVGVADCLEVKEYANDTEEIVLGISRMNANSPMIRSRVIKIAPRYVIENTLDFDIEFQQLENGKLVEFTLPGKGGKKSLTKFTAGKKKLMKAKVGGDR